MGRGKYLALAIALFVLAAVLLYHRQRLTIQPLASTLPADGATHEAFRVLLPFPDHAPPEEMNQMPTLRWLTEAGNRRSWAGMVTSPVTPGTALIDLEWRHRTVTIPLTFVLDANDSYSDGTPDFLRLHTEQDRQAFRSWFTAIAEAQAQLPPARVPAEIHDCAALLRYAYREALHAHDESWFHAHAFQSSRPSIRQYTYPRTPLGANLFRVRSGTFGPADLTDGTFAQFADARTLMQNNTYRVGRDLRLARPGDLIFYRQLEQDSPYDGPDRAQNHSPFHSMIVCGQKGSWVVYNTGPIHGGKGEMRQLLVSDLLHHPDARWRPLKENANFLGVYRWNILREGD